jgi:hypothetical protein
MENKRQWWAGCHSGDFTKRIKAMSIRDLQILEQEMRGTLSSMQTQLEVQGRADLGWWKGARAALGYTAQKKALLRKEIRNRAHTSSSNRRENFMLIRALAKKDPSAALVMLMDHFLKDTKNGE